MILQEIHPNIFVWIGQPVTGGQKSPRTYCVEPGDSSLGFYCDLTVSHCPGERDEMCILSSIIGSKMFGLNTFHENWHF